MSGIARVLIESGNKMREIELTQLADRVTVVFDDDREVIVSPTGVSSDGVQIADIGGSGGNSINAADNESTVQNVRAGRNAYVAGRDGNWNFTG